MAISIKQIALRTIDLEAESIRGLSSFINEDFEKAIAVAFLPIRLRAGLHGNWVHGQDLALID